MTNVNYGAAWKLKIEDLGEGDQLWTLTHFGKLTERGRAKSVKEAKKLGGEAFARCAEIKAAATSSRSYARMRLNQMLESRTHLVGGVVELLMMGADKKRIRREAEEAERAFWKSDKNPYKKPLSTHKLRKPADEAALQVVDLMLGCGMLEERGEAKDGSGEEGWNVKKVVRWAKEVIGESFFEDGDQAEEAEESAA